MKIGYFSDLHTEFLRSDSLIKKQNSRQMGLETFAHKLAESYAAADVIVAAGDIGIGVKSIRFLKLAFPSKPVIYIPGNHEHWTAEIHSTHRKMAAEAEGSNIHFFHDGGTIEIDGVMFCAATLWTDYALTDSRSKMETAERKMNDFSEIEIQDKPKRTYSEHVNLVMRSASSVMNDFYKIRLRHLDGKPYNKEIEARRLHPVDLLSLHRAHLANIKAAMALSLEQDKPLVVVTHHAPSARSLLANSTLEDMATYPYQQTDPFYASHLDYLMLGEDAPQIWIHGHTHIAMSYTIGLTRVRSNPKGYSDGEDTGFEFGKLIEIQTSTEVLK
jgi:hypothetical protein